MNVEAIQAGAGSVPAGIARSSGPGGAVPARGAAPVASGSTVAAAPAAGGAADPILQQVDLARARAARAAAQANERLAQKGRELSIEFDDELNRSVFKLVDSQTGEVVRQIPSEEVLAIARALAEDASAGVMLQTRI